MNYEFTMKFLILVIMAFMSGMLVYTLLSRDTNYLIERLKRGHAVTKRKSILDELLEIIKPFTVANLKNSRNKDIIRDMFIRLGMGITESEITDFENRRMLKLLVALGLSIVVCFVLLPFIKDSSVRLMFGAFTICMPAYMAYKMPTWALAKKIAKKERAFEKFFPDAIDLLCVCVEAGLSIDGAIERVGKEFTNFSYDVGYEFNRVAKDMLSGVSKQEALKGLAERVRNKDIQSFVAIIIQADKMGASIAHSLAISADSLRTKRKQRLDALVAAASTKMTIPLVLCLLPATFAVILTPAIIQVVEALGKMNGFK